METVKDCTIIDEYDGKAFMGSGQYMIIQSLHGSRVFEYYYSEADGNDYLFELFPCLYDCNEDYEWIAYDIYATLDTGELVCKK
jgi:hypothetical protein